MTGGSHLPNITIGECLFKVFIEEKNKQQQKEVTKELKNTFFSKLSKNLSPNNNNANKIRSPPTSPNNNGGNNPFLVTTSALGSSSSSVSTTSSSTTTTGSMSKSEDQIMVQKNLNLNLLHTNDTSPNGANHNTTNTTNGGKEEKKRRKSINDFFKNNIHKLQFKNRLVELRINELLIYAIKDNNKKKLKASISLIGTEITMNKQEITIYGKDKIISLQNSDDSIKEKWFRSLKEQSIINSSQSSSQSLQNLQNNNPILIHNEILNSSVTSGDNNTQNNFNTLQQPIDLVNQVITQINNLSTTTTHNNTDNHLSQQSLQQNYDFTKEQLSKLSNEFTKINNQSMNYHSLIGQLVMIGENVMNKANIEINSQSIYNMSGGVGILKQGYLRKAGPKEIDQKITINWKKRYCVLTELREFRYIAKIGEAPKGLFNVENAWVSRINLSIIGDDNIVTDIPDDNDNVTTTDNIPHDNKSHKNNSGAVNNGDNHYFFQIETPHRVYKFEAFSYESLKSWMTALKLAGANVKSDENDGIVLKGNLERYLKGKWKNLYFILLESKELKYYSKKGSAQKGTILLEDSYICDNLQKTLQNSSLQQNTQNSDEDLTLQFKIYTFDRNYTFKCKDLNTKKMWSTTLQKYGCQYKDMSNNTLQNTQILFKNRLQKYYLKTSDEILLERQEKLQNYIVNEENLKMKLLKNKNKFRVTRGTSNVTNIVTNNNNIVNNVTSGNIPKPPMIPPNTIVTNNNNTIVKVNSTTTNTTTNTINTTSDSSVVTVVNNNTVKKEESVMRNNNIVVQPRPPMGPPPSTYIPSSSSNKSTTTITTSTTLKSNTTSTTSNKEKEKKQEEEKIIEQSSKQEEKEQIVKQQEKEEKILLKEEEEKVKEQLSTTTTQQQQQQEEEEQKDVATTTTIPIINEPSNIPTTTATETATAIELTIESIHKEEQVQQESIKEEKETITTTTTPIAEETITIHPTVSSSEPEREPTPPTIITNSLKSLNIQPKSTTNSTSTPTTTHQRDSSIDSNNSFSFTLPSVTSNTSIDQLLLLDEHSNNNSINNSTTTFRMSNPPDSFRYSTTSRFSSATSSVVIDNGSGVLKAGFSHEEFPSKVFNNTIGRIKQYSAKGMFGAGNSGVKNVGDKQLYFGDGALALKGVLSLNYPVEKGIVKNFDDCEMILQYTCDSLQLESFSEQALLLTETPMNPKRNRERMTQIMFETFDVPQFYLTNGSVLSLYAYGYTTGLVLDSGDGVTNTVPIYEGFSLPHAIQRLDLAGKELTEYMIQLLNEKGHHFSGSAEFEIVKCLKEDVCYVNPYNNNNLYNNNCNNDNKIENNELKYELPDGTSLKLTSERYQCPELLFNPSLIGKESPGIAELCQQTIMKCDIDLRKIMANHIFLSGGSNKFKGINERLMNELIKLLPSGMGNKLRVNVNKDSQYLAWIGGSILCNMNQFNDLCISREEYQEYGPNYCHIKFM